MMIDKKIKLNNSIYYIIVDVVYKTDENNIIKLNIKNYKNDYYDDGNLSILIKK